MKFHSINLLCGLLIGLVLYAVWRHIDSDDYAMHMSQYQCEYDAVRVNAVWRYAWLHPCSRWIDRYRWSETQGMGYFLDGGMFCQSDQFTADRLLTCAGSGVARPVPDRKGRVLWGGYTGKEMVKILNATHDSIPGEARTNYAPPRK